MSIEEFRAFCEGNKYRHVPASEYIGIKIGKLLVVDYTKKGNMMRVRCDCGEEELKAKNFLWKSAKNFCCSKCGKLPRKGREDFLHLVGEKFGCLEVIEVLDFVPVLNGKGRYFNVIEVKTRCSLCQAEETLRYDRLKHRRLCDCQQPVFIGATFGRLTVVSGPTPINKVRYWGCACSCGGSREVSTYGLSSREVDNCGCLRGIRNREGDVIGSYTLKSFISLNENNHAVWNVECLCGAEETLNTTQLRDRASGVGCYHERRRSRLDTAEQKRDQKVQQARDNRASILYPESYIRMDRGASSYLFKCPMCGESVYQPLGRFLREYDDLCPSCLALKKKYSFHKASLLKTVTNLKQREVDLVGKRFGRLLVLSVTSNRFYRKSKGGNNLSGKDLFCLCSCGNTHFVNSGSVLRSRTISCGCYRKEVVSLGRKKKVEEIQSKHPWKYASDPSGQLKVLPKFTSWVDRLGWAEEMRPDPIHNYLLQVKCTYCGKWYTPSIDQCKTRYRALMGTTQGENRFYCSGACKRLCPTFGTTTQLKKTAVQTYVREVQPELRQLVFERDGYECQRCGEQRYLNCHHYTGVVQNPIESADVDNCVTLCLKCHKEAHRDLGCRYVDLRCA